MRQIFNFNITNPEFFKKQLLAKSKKLEYISILESNKEKSASNLPLKYINYDLIAGIDSLNILKANNNSFNQLRDFHIKNKDWMFGYLSYDLKNESEQLSSQNFDGIESPNLFFFIPKYVLILKNNILSVHTYESISVCKNFLFENSVLEEKDIVSVKLTRRDNKSDYINKIIEIKKHIQRGDVYELNYCQEFFSNNVYIDSEQLFFQLNKKNPTPFSAFIKLSNLNIISSSPERFLKKSKNTIIAQPIKGTIKRGLNSKEDKFLYNELKNSEKDISENIMITDLVRNDLSVNAKKKSVKVQELCKIYTFQNVHQMISTISSELRDNITISTLLKSTFPMGSMTGAPKVRAMELIEFFENFKRGIFSGSCGYITPSGDFDFNVVIRTVIYNSKKKYLSVGVGGAITINSEPENEYQECLIKAAPIFDVLNFKLDDK